MARSSQSEWMALLMRRSVKGHEEKFSPLTLSARYVIRQETFAGTHGNGRDAPKAVMRRTTGDPVGSTESQPEHTSQALGGTWASIISSLAQSQRMSDCILAASRTSLSG